MKPSPCFKCVRRHVGCHSTCKEYKDFRIDLDNRNKKIRDTKNRDSDFYAVTTKNCKKTESAKR